MDTSLLAPKPLPQSASRKQAGFPRFTHRGEIHPNPRNALRCVLASEPLACTHAHHEQLFMHSSSAPASLLRQAYMATSENAVMCVFVCLHTVCVNMMQWNVMQLKHNKTQCKNKALIAQPFA
eukprot:1149677-Pelagomonas_calceolata.AAC.2